MIESLRKLENFLQQELLGNQIRDFAWLLGILLLGILLKSVVSGLLSRIFYRFMKDKNESVPATVFIRLMRKPFETFTILIVLYLAFDRLEFPTDWQLAPIEKFGVRQVIYKGYQILLILSVTWILLRFIEFFAKEFAKKAQRTDTPLDDQLVPFFKELVKVLMVIFAFFFILGVVFNLNVASLIAGLGIGGLAVALAAKESLENLFASFTIFLDRPFVAGDVIQVGTISGKVEKVGFRSTRIRTFDKSFLTVPNKMLIDQALDNLTQRHYRRANFTIGLTYNTPPETLQSIIAELKSVLDAHEMTRKEPGVVKFSEFGTSSLNLLVVFFVDTPDWGEFMRVKEEINFRIIDIVKKHRASFAYPSTTVYVHNQNPDMNDNALKPFIQDDRLT